MRFEDIATLVDAAAPKPARPQTYKKRVCGVSKLFVFVGAALLAGSCGLAWSERYAAEVGHHHDGQVKWEIWGDFATLGECRSAAIAAYNNHVAKRRAHSWSCLLKNGKGGYTSRHR